MKRIMKFGLILGLLGFSPQIFGAEANTDLVVWCVGGPIKPSYAYFNYSSAAYCRDVVASQSRSCRRAVRLGRCQPFNIGLVNRVNPGGCLCAPPTYYGVGQWLYDSSPDNSFAE